MKNADNLLKEKIVPIGNKWQVQSEKGKNLGTYDTKAEAEKRLKQVEYFKYLDEYLDKDTLKRFQSKGRKLAYLVFSYLRDNKEKLNIGSGSFNFSDSNKYDFRVASNDPNAMGSWMHSSWEYKFNDDGSIDVPNIVQVSVGLNDIVNYYEAKWHFIQTCKHFDSLEDAIDDNHDWWNPLECIGSLDNILAYLEENSLDEKLNESLLLEKKRSELISKSKSGADYKSKDRKGQNRWDRRVYSKISTSVSDYNKIDMNTFWKEDLLEFGIKVQGETDNYVVTVTFEKILERLADEIKRNNNKLEFKNVLRALINTFNSEDVYVSCSCPDWVYSGNNYYSYRQGYNSNPEFGPAMQAPVLKNPTDDLGAGCKHINLILSNLTWMMKIASVINNYIWYCKDNMELNYAKYIFPKLYGMDYDKAIQLTLFDTDELETDEATINLSNALGRRRTQYKPKPETSFNPRFEKERKEKPESNPLKLQFNDEEKEEIKINEPEVGNEDEEEVNNG